MYYIHIKLMSKYIEQESTQNSRQKEIKNMTFRNQMKFAMMISQNQTKINEDEELEEEIFLDYEAYFREKKKKREDLMDKNILMERKMLYKQSLKEFDLIKKNIYINRKKYILKDEDAYICECIGPKVKKRQDISKLSEDQLFGCGDRCSNQLISWDCVAHLCPSGDSCRNRRFQLHQHSDVFPVKTMNRGWGLCAGEFLPKGSFVMQYIGEIYNISSSYGNKKIEEYKSKSCTYLMSLSDNEVIDPTYKGNLARFINHSCDPNCLTQKWYVLGEQCIGIFTLRDINEGEELTFNYNFDIYKTTFQRCLCESTNCKGYLGIAKNEGFDRISNSICRCCKNNVKASDKIIACDGCTKIFHFNCTRKSKFNYIISNKSNYGPGLNVFFKESFSLNIANLNNESQNVFICNTCLRRKKFQENLQPIHLNNLNNHEKVNHKQENYSISVNKTTQEIKVKFPNVISKDETLLINNNPKRSIKIISDGDYEDTIMNIKDKNPNGENIAKNTIIRMSFDDLNAHLPKNINQIPENQIESKAENEENNNAYDNIYFEKAKSISNFQKEDLFNKEYENLKYSHSMKIENNFENKSFNFDNINSKIIDDDSKSNKSDYEEEDFSDFIIDDTIQVESKNLQKIRSNLNSLCLIGARLFWDFRLTNNPNTDIKITGSKSQITKIKIEINKIISSGNHRNTFKSKYNIEIDYDTSLITDEIFNITELSKITVKGLEKNVNKVATEIENYLFNMKVVSIHLMNTDYIYVKTNICPLKTSIDPGDVRLRKKDSKIEREIKHSFYYVPPNARDLVIIGFENEIKKGQRVIRDFLLRQNTLEYNQSLCFLCPTYLINTINTFKNEVADIINNKSVRIKIIEPNFTRKHLNLHLEGKWKDIIFIKNLLYRYFMDYYNSSTFQNSNMSHLASLNFLPNKKKSSINDFHQYIYNQEHKLISKNLRKFFIEKNYMIKNWDYISEEIFLYDKYLADKKNTNSVNNFNNNFNNFSLMVKKEKEDFPQLKNENLSEKEDESNTNILKMFLKTYDRDTALNYMINQNPGEYKKYFNLNQLDLCDHLIFYLEEANNSYNHHRRENNSERTSNNNCGNYNRNERTSHKSSNRNGPEESRSFYDNSDILFSEYEPNNNGSYNLNYQNKKNNSKEKKTNLIETNKSNEDVVDNVKFSIEENENKKKSNNADYNEINMLEELNNNYENSLSNKNQNSKDIKNNEKIEEINEENKKLKSSKKENANDIENLSLKNKNNIKQITNSNEKTNTNKFPVEDFENKNNNYFNNIINNDEIAKINYIQTLNSLIKNSSNIPEEILNNKSLNFWYNDNINNLNKFIPSFLDINMDQKEIEDFHIKNKMLNNLINQNITNNNSNNNNSNTNSSNKNLNEFENNRNLKEENLNNFSTNNTNLNNEMMNILYNFSNINHMNINININNNSKKNEKENEFFDYKEKNEELINKKRNRSEIESNQNKNNTENIENSQNSSNKNKSSNNLNYKVGEYQEKIRKDSFDRKSNNEKTKKNRIKKSKKRNSRSLSNENNSAISSSINSNSNSGDYSSKQKRNRENSPTECTNNYRNSKNKKKYKSKKEKSLKNKDQSDLSLRGKNKERGNSFSLSYSRDDSYKSNNSMSSNNSNKSDLSFKKNYKNNYKDSNENKSNNRNFSKNERFNNENSVSILNNISNNIFNSIRNEQNQNKINDNTNINSNYFTKGNNNFSYQIDKNNEYVIYDLINNINPAQKNSKNENGATSKGKKKRRSSSSKSSRKSHSKSLSRSDSLNKNDNNSSNFNTQGSNYDNKQNYYSSNQLNNYEKNKRNLNSYNNYQNSNNNNYNNNRREYDRNDFNNRSHFYQNKIYNNNFNNRKYNNYDRDEKSQNKFYQNFRNSSGKGYYKRNDNDKRYLKKNYNHDSDSSSNNSYNNELLKEFLGIKKTKEQENNNVEKEICLEEDESNLNQPLKVYSSLKKPNNI